MAYRLQLPALMKTSWLGLMFLTALYGCAGKPCETSSQCGSNEVCAQARCQQLSCDKVWYATDPSSGSCRPLPACDNKDEVRTWSACADPCGGLDEKGCVADARCQPAYSTTNGVQPPALCDAATAGQGGIGPRTSPPFPGCGGPTGDRKFEGCHGNPLRVDPCDGKDAVACKADARCTMDQINFDLPGCDCPPNADCICPGVPARPPECRLKTCLDGSEPGQCHFGCESFNEKECLQHSECHPVGEPCYCPPNVDCVCGGGKFLFCEPDDGIHRCDSDSECASDQRCNKDEICSTLLSAPTACHGLCVPKGCAGYGEKQCNGDPTCQPVYSLNCTPYGDAGGFAPCGGAFPPDAKPLTTPVPPGCGQCEPTFNGCVDAVPGSVVDSDKSVLLRQPAVVDQPAFAFANVMQKLAGAGDPARFVTRWLEQLGSDATVDGKLAKARTGARSTIASLARRPDGLIDLAKLDFQVTSLSNRIDLAGPSDCGEARITYALGRGVSERRNRMTVIVELRQPDDASACQATARRWIALSQLDGAPLAQAAAELYAPLIAPQNINQIRTNEFLVTFTDPGALEPWELREFHLGSDGLLHLALSKQAVDPLLAQSSAFRAWVTQNAAAIVAGSALVPAEYLAVTSSENGARLQSGHSDFKVDGALNKMACAGCHTTETNTAFAHVAERFAGSGRALISEFLRRELPVRGKNLFKVAQGRMSVSDRLAIHSTH
jgi:hypothetical protein